MRRALQKYIEDPLSDALIQGVLPRPSELEVYLGDAGIYCRPVKELQEQPVGAGGAGEEVQVENAPGTPLYMFQ